MVGKLPSQPQALATPGLVRRTSTQEQVPLQASAAKVDTIEVDAVEVIPVAVALSPKATKSPMLKLWLWLVMMVAGTSVSSGSAAIAFNLLLTVPPETDCHQIPPATDRDILACGYQAMQMNTIEAVVTSLERIKHWTAADPLYTEGQQASEQWSRTILGQAKRKAQNNQGREAIALIKSIPRSSSLYSLAQHQLVALKQQQQVMQPLVDLAHVALQQQNWPEAQQQINALAQLSEAQLSDETSFAPRSPQAASQGLDAWFHFGQRQAFQVDQLSRRLRLEQHNARILQQVQQTAKSGLPHALGLALQQVQAIDQTTYVWATAQAQLEPLATEWLNYGEWQCQRGDLAGAIATAQQVALIPALAEEAGYLEQLCRAQQLAIATTHPWTPSLQDSLQLVQACAMLEAIPPNSRFHAHTHRYLRQWRLHLEDLRYLHLAHLAARMGWSPTLAWAVQQTEKVAPDRPRRLQAQTLSAHWQQQLEKIQPHPGLTWSSQVLSAR
ncbi:MAG: hypothetical protein AB4042_18320 [Leptolyngbyaceae cyanobacterium]